MKTGVLIAILVVAALAIGAIVFTKPAYPMTQEDAKKFFLEDLKEKYPGADVREVTEILNVTAPDGSTYYQLKARVTTGLNSPCPERLHVYYDYPPKNFVAQPPEYITSGCQVCINEPVCTLAFPEEAIIASHTYNGTEKVSDFIKQNADAAAQADFMENFAPYGATWRVFWSSPSSSENYTVFISKGSNEVIQIRHGDDILPESVYDIGAACSSDSECRMPENYVRYLQSYSDPDMAKCIEGHCMLLGTGDPKNCTLASDCGCEAGEPCYCIENMCRRAIIQ